MTSLSICLEETREAMRVSLHCRFHHFDIFFSSVAASSISKLFVRLTLVQITGSFSFVLLALIWALSPVFRDVAKTTTFCLLLAAAASGESKTLILGGPKHKYNIFFDIKVVNMKTNLK